MSMSMSMSMSINNRQTNVKGVNLMKITLLNYYEDATVLYSSFRRRIQRVTYLASSLHHVSSNDSFTHGVPNCNPIVDGLFEVARGKK